MPGYNAELISRIDMLICSNLFGFNTSFVRLWDITTR